MIIGTDHWLRKERRREGGFHDILTYSDRMHQLINGPLEKRLGYLGTKEREKVVLFD